LIIDCAVATTTTNITSSKFLSIEKNKPPPERLKIRALSDLQTVLWMRMLPVRPEFHFSAQEGMDFI